MLLQSFKPAAQVPNRLQARDASNGFSETVVARVHSTRTPISRMLRMHRTERNQP